MLAHVATLLVKQFMQSMNGPAFYWYVDHTFRSVDSPQQMEKKFLNNLYK